jgi:ectoine hydroxylase-related dioxygenase (phytanoyl-CoA dioxygenase family)
MYIACVYLCTVAHNYLSLINRERENSAQKANLTHPWHKDKYVLCYSVLETIGEWIAITPTWEAGLLKSVYKAARTTSDIVSI